MPPPSNFLDELSQDEEEAAGGDFLAQLQSEATAPPPAQQAAPMPWWKRELGLGARGIIEGIAGLPMMAADAGVSARNVAEIFRRGETPGIADFIPFVGGKRARSEYELPSSMLSRGLTELGLPEPETGIEKAANFATAVVTGAGINPTTPANVPANFVRPAANPLAQVARDARAAGYVIPPSSSNPGMASSAIESIAGKAATAQAASIKNQAVTNQLARRALGLPDNIPITPQTLELIRKNAGQVYEQIGNSGEIVADDQFLSDLAKLGSGANEIAASFPGANVGAKKQISELADSLFQPQFSAKSALQYLRELRKQASGNLGGPYDPAKQALGMAQKEAAATLEDLIGRHLSASGKADLAQQFAGARRTIAITHTVEDALNETTGNVIASKLGQQLARGKPLSGSLEEIARFSRAFPKAAKEVTESMPGISPLDWYASGGAAALTGNIAPLAWPLARIGTRSAILSGPAQRSGVAPLLSPLAPMVAPAVIQTLQE